MNRNLDLSPEMVEEALTLNFTGENDDYLDFQGRKSKGTLLRMKDTVRRVTYKFKNRINGYKYI